MSENNTHVNNDLKRKRKYGSHCLRSLDNKHQPRENQSVKKCKLNIIFDNYERVKRKKSMQQRNVPAKLTCKWHKCGLTFEIINEFKSHIITHTQAVEQNDEGEYECEFKGCTFKDESSGVFYKHVLFHVYHERLKNIGMSVAHKQKLPKCMVAARFRLPEVYDDYACQWSGCNFCFTNIVDFIHHVKTHINEVPSRPPEGEYLYCKWFGCQSKFLKQLKMGEHLRVHSKERLVACPTCENMFASNTKFGDHRKRQIPVDQQSFQCSECSKVYGTAKLLREHMRSHINVYKCTMCDMTSSRPSWLANHIRFRHLDDRAYKCNLCEFASVTKGNLELHLLSHCSENLYSCDDCDFSCRTLQTLERHIQKNHSTFGCPEKYECHVCKERFRRGIQLSRHLMRRHEVRMPSGHSRFRYKEHSDGIFRLYVARYESLEAMEQVFNENPPIDIHAKFKLKQNALHSFTIEHIDEDGDKGNDIILKIDDVDEKGNVVKSEIIETKEILNDD